MKYALATALLLPAIAVLIPLKAQNKSFEAASIKEALPLSIENVRAGQFHLGMNIDGSRADYGFVSLADLIAYAYRVKRYQVSGPAWMNDRRWDIVAKLPTDQSAAGAPEMMQALMAERFKLAIHRESRKQPVYELLNGSGDIKMKKATPEGVSSATPGIVHIDGSSVSGGPAGTVHIMTGPNGGVRMQMAKVTMSALADMLMQFMDRPIVNATKLQGDYEVMLDLPGDLMTGLPAAQKFTAILGLGPIGIASDTSGPAVLQAVKNLGLELKPSKAPVETIIVDHLEKIPTAN